MSYGEVLSSQIIAARFTAGGIENAWKDSRELIITDSQFGHAAVDFAVTNQKIQDYFSKATETLFVLPGFIASDGLQATTTLGRGGSDYTAAIVAAAIPAKVVEIWTDGHRV